VSGVVYLHSPVGGKLIDINLIKSCDAGELLGGRTLLRSRYPGVDLSVTRDLVRPLEFLQIPRSTAPHHRGFNPRRT
jgi:hypothetical protein